jgi:radical SAM superfamily enzyme with C-terminal helix-hairpin-helix motif
VLPSREEFEGVRSRSDFERFKRAVREQIDQPMLERLVPDGTVLASVYAEVREGGRTFGRQVGTYPLLIDIPYPIDVGRKMDVAVVGRGFRSVVGIVHPTDVNTATLSMLESVPGIGKKTAMAIVRNRPFRSAEDLWKLFQDPKARASAQLHLTCGNAQLQ